MTVQEHLQVYFAYKVLHFILVNALYPVKMDAMHTHPLPIPKNMELNFGSHI